MQSPWLYQLNRNREVIQLSDHIETDVCVVGGGIAGVTTAYYLLKNTDKTVVLLEADKVAHGATGHNAGQVASYFERSFKSLVDEFGVELAAAGQNGVEGAWSLLEQIIADADIQTPLLPVTGYAGLSSFSLLVEHLENTVLKYIGGIPAEMLYVSEDLDLSLIPEELHKFFAVLPHSDILALLETKDTRYIAALSGKKGCLNSALFTEELAGYLLKTYPDRFQLAEDSKVTVVRLHEQSASVETELNYTVSCNSVVLCTNGFSRFSIVNEAGANIDTNFHESIHGTVGYMVGYLDDLKKPPTAMSFLDTAIAESGNADEPDVYYYLTRRPFEYERQQRHNLICVGGPDMTLPAAAEYSRTLPHPESTVVDVETFLERTVEGAPESPEFTFRWHGLMGYTPNSVRRVGPEPLNNVLYYNLGCNGVGILPSVYGAHRIARYHTGESVEPSIFDVPMQEGVVEIAQSSSETGEVIA